MTVAVVCASHVPLALCDETPAPQRAQFLDCMRSVGDWIRQFDPEFIIEFGPDHFNGFFYDAMPNFCIGLSANGLGDWKTSRGPLNVPRQIALEACAAVRKAGIDLDLAQEMKVDHGFTQIIELMLGDIGAYPLIPVMLNCAAPPLPAFRRVRLLGEALGAFAKDTRRRVLIVGSGGLSHDPPVPQFDSVDDGQRKLMVNGRNPSADVRKQREQRVVTAAIDFYAGRNHYLAPDPLWDKEFIGILRSGSMSDADGWADGDVTAVAGCGGHEVRTWIAAFSALKGAAVDGYKTTVEYYETIPQWMTGVGIVRAQ